MQKAATCRQIVIDDIEDLTFNTFYQSCERNSIGTIINVSEWNPVGTAKMQEHAEGRDSDTASYCLITRSKHVPWPHNDARETEVLCVVIHQLLLLRFRKIVSTTS